MTAWQQVVTPVKTGVQRIEYDLRRLDSGPFDKPFGNLRVLSNVEGLRVPSLSRDFRRNEKNADS